MLEGKRPTWWWARDDIAAVDRIAKAKSRPPMEDWKGSRGVDGAFEQSLQFICGFIFLGGPLVGGLWSVGLLPSTLGWALALIAGVCCATGITCAVFGNSAWFPIGRLLNFLFGWSR
jgi:hypothetical protein